MSLPVILGSCSNVKPLALNHELLKANSFKDVSIKDGMASTLAYTSTGYPTFYGSEKHTHSTYQAVMGTIPSLSSDTLYHNTGIKFYGSTTSSSVGTTNSIYLNQTGPYIDFSEADVTYPSQVKSMCEKLKNAGTTTDVDIPIITKYRLEVLNGSGGTAYFIDMTIEDFMNDAKTVKINKNGVSQIVTQTRAGIDPKALGKVSASLYNSTYTLKLTIQYLWLYEKDVTNPMNGFGFIQSTSTLTGKLIIDTYKPSLVAKTVGSLTYVSNGSYAKENVKVTAADSNLNYLHYQGPSASGTTTSGSYTTSEDGEYEFYATDKAGNKTDTIQFMVDTAAPVGRLYANGIAINSGKYVSTSFSYVASDNGSGLASCYYKSPKASSFVVYSSGSLVPNNSGDGWYEFYSVDKAGNESEHLKVYLETSTPEVTILRNGASVYKDSVTSGGIVDTGLYFNENDSIEFAYKSSSGVHNDGVFHSGTQYALKKAAFPLQTYSNTIVTATGVSVTYKFDIVREKPYLLVGGDKKNDGSILRYGSNQAVSLKVDEIIDSGNCIAEISDGTKSYSKNILSDNSLSLTAEEGEEKTYSIKITDAAGNVSSFTVIIDKAAADGQWKYRESIIPNNSYVNHPVFFDFDEEEASATYSKDGGEFKGYSSGTELKEEGTYVVLLKDSVGNTSEFRITLDYTAPKGQFYLDGSPTDDGFVTNKSFYFTWDGDDACLLNGNSYSKNTLVEEEGTYEFVLKDKAGNEMKYHAEIDKTAPSYNKNALEDDSKDALSITKWYEVRFGDEKKDFADHSSALDYAKEKERSAYVKSYQLDDVNDFTEIGLVASNGNPNDDSDKIRTGTYWGYKSKSNPDVTLYYFDEKLLEDTVSYYASKYVSEAKYSDGSTYPEGLKDDSWSYGDYEGKIANGYSLINDGDAIKAVARKCDAEVVLDYGKPLGEQLSESGVWTITEIDRAGNECSYDVIIDHGNPGLAVITESFSGESNEIQITDKSLKNNDTYYLKSLSLKSILSGDIWAEVEIEKNGEVKRYIASDALPTIDEKGKYSVKVFDRLGHSISFTVYISGEEERISFKNNSDDTSVSIDIEVPESYEAITSLEIYRNGEKLEGVSTDKLTYVFSKDGLYKVVLKDNFGRTIEKEYRFTKSLPNGTLNGVENGGKTNKDVIFSYDPDKYFAEVYKDGELYRLDQTGSVTIPASESASGRFEIKLINNTDEDNYKTYSFEMDCIAPGLSLEGVEDKGTTNGSVTASWKDTDVVSATYTYNGGEQREFENGSVFDKEGTYVLILVDDLGNTTTKSFTIDKTVDYVVRTSDGKIIQGDATTSDDVIIEANEGASIKVIKDGEAYDYSFGDVLSEEGTYLITMEDAFGNKNSFTIVIDKTVDFDINVADGGITNDGVTINSKEKTTIVVTKDGLPYSYKAGEEINGEGSYEVLITDAYGNSKKVTFQIVSPDAKTSVDYELGEDCEIISITKYGRPVSSTGNRIHLTEDGTYVITYKKDGRTYSFTLCLDTTAPEVTLNGVADGGTIDGSVIIDGMTEEGTIEVYKDGQKIDYELGQELKDYGHYEVVVKDKLGNTRTYFFTLKFQMNAWAITLIALGLASAVAVVTTIVIKRKRTFKK